VNYVPEEFIILVFCYFYFLSGFLFEIRISDSEGDSLAVQKVGVNIWMYSISEAFGI